MPQRSESRRRLPPAFWLAQGFVGLAMLLLSFRHRGDADAGAIALKSSSRERTTASCPPPEIIPPAAPQDIAVSVSPPERRGLNGAPYAWEDYRSQARVLEDYIQWTLDPRELAWLLANRRQVLGRDLETDPELEGGLRIKSIREGSFGERRGIRVGDVLLDINGQELDSPSDLEDFLEDPGYSGAGGWRVRLKRGQDVLLLDYRSAS
jgi:hypothetical protein